MVTVLLECRNCITLQVSWPDALCVAERLQLDESTPMGADICRLSEMLEVATVLM